MTTYGRVCRPIQELSEEAIKNEASLLRDGQWPRVVGSVAVTLGVFVADICESTCGTIYK